jgi:alcohol dehydrogenase, propanol-preferring
MRAARMHGYKQPLRLEEIPIPDIGRGDFAGRAVIVYD